MASQDNINVFEPDLRDSAILPLQPDRPGPVISYLTRPMVPSPKQRRRDTLRGIASFVPFLSGELARVEGDKLGETLGLLDALGPAAVPAKAAAKVATKAVDLNKGIASIPTPTNPRYDLTRHQEDLFTGNPIADANKMYDRALRLGPEFKSQIDNVASELNLETTLPELGIKIDSDTLLPVGTTKKIPRMIEKAKGKYEGDISQVTDPIRTRIVVNNPAEEESVAKLIGQKYDVFDKGREIKEGTGFVDRKINIKFTGSNGEPLVGEVGIITAPMWRASDKAHKKYERFRSLFPQGMPTDPIELGKINRNVRLEGEKLLKEMDEIFKNAKDQIDPNFYDTVKKFAEGGYVTSGSSGRSLPITPNFVSKSVLDIFDPSTKKSTTWFGAATVQSGLPEVKKYPKSASPIGFSTAGPSSHVKYNVSIDSSLQKFTNNYNTKDINIFDT